MEQKYSPEIAKEIIGKFHQKGWNLYKTNDPNEIGPDDIIRQNLAESLEVGSKYVLLPVADDPKDPVKVIGALEILAQKLNRDMPTIKIGYSLHPITGITLEKDVVKIHSPEGLFVSYPIFIEALGSIVQTK